MNKFVMGVSSMIEKECRTEMFHNDMDIFRLMLYAQQIKESKLMHMTRDGKRTRSDELSQPKSKKRSFNQDSPIGNTIGSPTKILKEVVKLIRGLAELVLGSDPWVGVFPEQMVALGVVIRVTRCGTSLASRKKERGRPSS